MRKMKSLVATIVALMPMPTLEVQVCKTPNLPKVSSRGEVQVDPLNIRAHVKFLARDLLEGRGLASGAETSPPIRSRFGLQC